MKRDMELIRKLLVFFDEKPGPEVAPEPPIPGYDEFTLKYHMVLLYDAGFLRCEPIKSSTSDRVYDVLPFDLTWAGHEFLARIRTDAVWESVREDMRRKGFDSLPLEVVGRMADKAIRRRLEAE